VKLIWSGAAIADRHAIVDFIAADSPRAAIAMDLELADRTDALKIHPMIGRLGRLPQSRELVLIGTPYLIIYRILETHIQILRVLHAAQQWPPK
jgi:addiction module RelE/StbE family toxin